MLEFAEEALDEIASAVERGLDCALDDAVPLGRDVGAASLGWDEVDDGAGVVAAIGDQRLGGRQAVKQSRDGRLVGGLARRDQQPDRQAVLIDDRVDLGAQSSTRTADGVIRAPFLPPAACWWARTIELSIKWSDCGDLAAKTSNTLSQTPAFAHLLKRL